MWGDPASWQRHRRAGFLLLGEQVGVRLEEGAPRPRMFPGSPQAPWAGAYLENHQGQRAGSGSPCPGKAFFKVVLGLLGEGALHGLRALRPTLFLRNGLQSWCPGTDGLRSPNLRLGTIHDTEPFLSLCELNDHEATLPPRRGSCASSECEVTETTLKGWGPLTMCARWMKGTA